MVMMTCAAVRGGDGGVVMMAQDVIKTYVEMARLSRVTKYQHSFTDSVQPVTRSVSPDRLLFDCLYTPISLKLVCACVLVCVYVCVYVGVTMCACILRR